MFTVPNARTAQQQKSQDDPDELRPQPQPQPQPQTVIPIDFKWKDGLLYDDQYHLHIQPCSFNAEYALRHSPDWSNVLSFDLNSSEVALQSPIPGSHSDSPLLYPSFPCPWQDYHSILTSNWLQSQRISVGKDIAWDAVNIVARSRPFHSIRQYLSSLEWDRTPRIDTWLSNYLDVDPTPFSLAVGPRFLISGVARIFDPGCKVDTCLILEGRQGRLKSTALETLAVNPAWFTDEIPSLMTKDADIQLRGIWIVEFSEFDAVKGVSWSRVKSFLSRKSDRYRPVHGKRSVTFPRQTIFTASINHFNYLEDETGARRFWPVETGYIDLDALRADRDQLWAEAVERYHTGSKWHLDKGELVRAAEAEQSARYEADVWQAPIEAWVSNRTQITIHDALAALGVKPADQTRAEQMRVSKCFQALGWKKVRTRIGDKRDYAYRRANLDDR